MSPKPQHYDFANQLVASQDFFERSTRVLDEADSGFRPREGMMTVAQQVAHTAQTLDWFIEGAFRPEGYDLDFAKHARPRGRDLAGRRPPDCSKRRTPTLSRFSARAAWRISRGHSRPADHGRPAHQRHRMAMVEHTAHHRGALTVLLAAARKSAAHALRRVKRDRPQAGDGQAKACPTTSRISLFGGACFSLPFLTERLALAGFVLEFKSPLLLNLRDNG